MLHAARQASHAARAVLLRQHHGVCCTARMHVRATGSSSRSLRTTTCTHNNNTDKLASRLTDDSKNTSQRVVNASKRGLPTGGSGGGVGGVSSSHVAKMLGVAGVVAGGITYAAINWDSLFPGDATPSSGAHAVAVVPEQDDDVAADVSTESDDVRRTTEMIVQSVEQAEELAMASEDVLPAEEQAEQWSAPELADVEAVVEHEAVETAVEEAVEEAHEQVYEEEHAVEVAAQYEADAAVEEVLESAAVDEVVDQKQEDDRFAVADMQEDTRHAAVSTADADVEQDAGSFVQSLDVCCTFVHRRVYTYLHYGLAILCPFISQTSTQVHLG